MITKAYLKYPRHTNVVLIMPCGSLMQLGCFPSCTVIAIVMMNLKLIGNYHS